MKKERLKVFSWALYDWGNSAFATTIMAGLFPIFFTDFWSKGADITVTSARLGFGNSIAGILVALLAPILGAISDRGSYKKRLLFFFAFIGALASSCLYTVMSGQWELAVLLYVAGSIGFSGGNIFYDSLLPEVSNDKNVNFVSSLGFALGYLGGGILFAFNVYTILSPELFGFSNASEAVRFAFLTVGIWWGMFTIPILIFVKEKEPLDRQGGIKAVIQGFKQLYNTFKDIRKYREVFIFLLAYWLYIDGVDTIIKMAVAYGKLLGFDGNSLIVALLITQFVGFPSALLFSYLSKKINEKKAIYVAIFVYLCATIWGGLMTDVYEFYALAIVIGLVQGGIQATSRSYFSKLIPKDKSGEYFGFYNMTGKFAAIFGPILMGGTGYIMSKVFNYSENTALRMSILSISILFIAGGIILNFSKEKR